MKNKNLIIRKAYRRVVSTLINLVARQTNYDIKNTLLLIGSTRSGTTFLMESINQENEYRLIFEPFNGTYTSEWSEFFARHYVDPDQSSSHEKSVVNNILIGRVKNNWVDQFNRKIRSDKRLIKAVRANLLVEHIRKENPTLPIVYLVRNPYDTVASRINMNFDATDVYHVLDQTSFVAKYYQDINIEDLKMKLDSKEANHAALWCLENRYLLKLQSELSLQLLRYEAIKGHSVSIKNGKLELTRKESKPSATTTLRSTYQLSRDERDNIKGILEIFGMQDIN